MQAERSIGASQQFIDVSRSIERLSLVKNKKDKKSQGIITKEYEFLERMYRSSEEDVTRLKIVCGISDMPQSRELLEYIVENEKEPLIRHEAAFGLGLTEDSAAIPLLVEKGLNDVNDVVRHESALALGHIGDKIALSSLKELLVNEKLYGKQEDNIVAPSCEVAIAQINYRNLNEKSE